MDVEKIAAGLSERMHTTRKARKMSLEQVANASGLTKSHVWELEQGRSKNPTIRAVWGVASALCVSPAWLLGLATDEPSIDPLALEIAALINERLATRAHLEKTDDPE